MSRRTARRTRATVRSRATRPVARLIGEVSGRRAALIGALVGTLYALIAWGGLSWLTSPYWSTLGFPDSNDIASGVAATAHFVRSPWTLPLFEVPTFVFESGSGVVVQTNAVPIAALVAKLAYPFFGEINAMGLWQLIVPILQGAAAAWAAAQMGASRAGVIGAALLATGYGHFTQKMAVHPMLATHALPIVILGLGAGIVRGRIAPLRGAVVAIAVPGVALLSNPYLAGMCLPIAVATVAAAVRAGLPWRRGLLVLGGGAAFFVAILVLGGYTQMPYEGGRLFGRWSANVFGLFVRHASEPPWGGIWDWIPRLTAAPEQQHDSGVWIGLGGWLVLLVALARLRLAGLLDVFRRHAPLVLAVVATCVFSWSQRVYVGETLVADITLPERVIDLVDPFRWSGRFAWVPAYALLIGGAAAASRISLPRAGRTSGRIGAVAASLVLVAGGLQWWTAIDGEMGTAHLYRDGAPVSPERRTQEALVAGAAHVRLFPSYFCGERRYAEHPTDPGNWDRERLAQESFIYFGVAAGRAGATIDAMQIARGYDRGFGANSTDCPNPVTTREAVTEALAAPATSVVLFGADAMALIGRDDLVGRCLAFPSYTACPASGVPPIDDWATRAGLPIGRGGLPLIDGPLDAGDPRLGALAGVAEGFERRISTQELWATWSAVGRGDPRLDEARYPLTTERAAVLRLAWPAAQGTLLVLTLQAGDIGAQIDGRPTIASGETIEWVGAGDCRDGVCVGELTVPLIDGSLALRSLAPTR